MFLTGLHLRNFRGYRHLDLKLDPLTTLLGQNEAGKKTVLRALDIFFNGSAAKRPLKLQVLNQEALDRGDWEIAISCTFDQLTVKKVFDLKNYLAEKDYFKERTDQAFQEVNSDNLGHYRELVSGLPLYVFFDEESKATSPLNFVVRSAIRDKRQEIKEVQDFLDARVGRNLSQVLANYQELAPGPKPNFVFKEQNLAEMIKRQTTIEESSLQTSSRIVLAFMLAQSENANIENVIYAFEENNLTNEEEDKLAQAALKLVAKGKQVILIPHTPYLMGLLPLEGARMVKQVAGQREFLQEEEVLEEAQKNLGVKADQRAVQSRCVLLVEGQEDVRFVNKVNQWMYEAGLVDQTFSQKGLFILPVGGCGSLISWLNFDLFSRLNEPWFIMIDSDKGTPEADQSRRHLRRIENKYPQNKSHVHATFKREIENYLVFKEDGQVLKFAPYEDVKLHMYNLMEKRHRSWAKDKTASKLMENMTLADLQDHYQRDGQERRELVEFFLKIDHFINKLDI